MVSKELLGRQSALSFSPGRIQTPPISAALDVLHHQHAERKGLETLARFSCALQEFAQSQWGERCHVTDRTRTECLIKEVLSVYSCACTIGSCDLWKLAIGLQCS